MDLLSMYKAIEDEIKRSIAKRYKNNNGTINLIEVIDEAAYCLAVNTIISERQISNATNGRLTKVDSETIYILKTGMNKALDTLFPNKLTPELYQMLEKQYEAILLDRNRIVLINHHYNNLFGSEGNNVL